MKMHFFTKYSISTTVALLSMASPTLNASIFGRNGQLLDGCPVCAARMAGSDGGPVSPIYGNSELSAPPSTTNATEVPPLSLTPPTEPSPAIVSAVALPISPSKSRDMAAPVIVGSPSAPPVAAKTEPSSEIKQGPDGFWRVSFANLASYIYPTPPETAAARPGSVEGIPAEVRGLEGKRIAVTGFMLPVKMENGLVQEFLLIRNPMVCCYGVAPAVNEWVLVKMKGKGIAAKMDQPLNFYGTLHVGVVVEEKMFAGLYELEGEKVAVE